MDKEGCMYRGIIQLDKLMNEKMKESTGSEYIRRVKLICNSNLNAGDFISDLNASDMMTSTA